MTRVFDLRRRERHLFYLVSSHHPHHDHKQEIDGDEYGIDQGIAFDDALFITGIEDVRHEDEPVEKTDVLVIFECQPCQSIGIVFALVTIHEITAFSDDEVHGVKQEILEI